MKLIVSSLEVSELKAVVVIERKWLPLTVDGEQERIAAGDT